MGECWSHRLATAVATGDGLRLTVGIGGGGAEFTRWLTGLLGWELAGATPVRTDRGLEWQLADWTLIDSAAVPPAFELRPHIGSFTIVRREAGPAVQQLELPAEAVVSFLSDHLSVNRMVAGALAEQIASATSIADVPGLATVAEAYAEPGFRRRIEGAVRQAASFREHFREMQAHGGARLLDLGRVVYLFTPEPMHLGDEWAELASTTSKRAYSLADINHVLSEFPELFVTNSHRAVPTVSAANAFVCTLFSGYVPSSSSEHLDIFHWMSKRAVDSLVRADSSDSFMRANLPTVAARANAIPDLLEDGAVMLAADIGILVDHLERDPQLMVQPAAKAVLLHAHRLHGDRADREAQMEFALRRMSLTGEADRIAAALPERAWRPVWSSTSPTNVHRVVCEGASGALAIDVVEDTTPFRAYAGFGSGSVRLLNRHHGNFVVVSPDDGTAEVRGVAVACVDGSDYVATASSDAVVRVYRVDDPSTAPKVHPLWSDGATLESPLTAAGVWAQSTETAVLFSGGVLGTVWRHDLVSGELISPLVEWGAEIRSIRPVEIDGRCIVAIVAVDGRVGIVDHEAQQVLSVATLTGAQRESAAGLLTPTCMNAVWDGEAIHLIVGCATGELFRAIWRPNTQIEVSELVLPGVPKSGVNSLKIFATDDKVTIFVARNDGVWLRFDPTDPKPVKVFVGHAGPVLSLEAFTVPATGEIVCLSGGSEGTVRIWRHVETVAEALGYLRVNRHRGAVRAIEVRTDSGAVDVVTGGDDGDVRLWRGAAARRALVVSQHQMRVTRFLWLRTPTGQRLVVGAADGSLRLVTVDQAPEPARLLGIAHEGITALAPSSAEGIFWSAGNDGAITRWDALAGVARGTKVICRYGMVTAMVTDQLGRVYVGGQDCSLSVVDPDTLDFASPRLFESAVTSLDLIPELHLLIVGLASGMVQTLDLGSGLRGAPRNLFTHDVGLVAVKGLELHGQAAVVSIGRDRRLVVVDVNSRSVLHEISLEGFPTDMAADEKFIAVSTTAGATLFEFFEGQLFTAGTGTVR